MHIHIFLQKNITPRFEFGFGLSYTTFKYSNLHINKMLSDDDVQSDLAKSWEAGNASPIAKGSSVALWYDFGLNSWCCGLNWPGIFKASPTCL